MINRNFDFIINTLVYNSFPSSFSKLLHPEAVVQRCYEKLLYKISQNSQEKTCDGRPKKTLPKIGSS